jgi:hypothetical protein
MKKSVIIRACVIVAAMLMTVAVALAAEQKKKRPSSYFNARGGLFLPTGDWNDGDWEPRQNIEMALGYHFLPFLALEGGFHHFRTFMSQTTSYYSDVKLYGNGVVLTAKLIYPGRRIQLYLGGGAGHYWVMEGIFISLPVVGGYFEIEDTIWGFHAVAGASYDLFRWLYLNVA